MSAERLRIAVTEGDLRGAPAGATPWPIPGRVASSAEGSLSLPAALPG
jgi:hypothetical protein